MPLSWNRHCNITIKALKRMFTEPISNKILKLPILWGRHTFSEKTISQLQVFRKNKGNYLFIKHPYTREKCQLDGHIILPENLIIQDLLLIFSYCKSEHIMKKQIHKIFVYFINALLIQQKKLNNINYIKINNNSIQDLLLNDVVKFFNCTNAVLKILTATKLSKISSYYKKYRPSDAHLNGILFKAIKQNNSRIINLILTRNIRFNCNLTDKHGKTALHWSCYHNNYQLTKILLRQKAGPSIQDFKGVTPIKIAKDNNNIKIIMLLNKYACMQNKPCLFSYSGLNYKDKLKHQYTKIEQEHVEHRYRYRY